MLNDYIGGVLDAQFRISEKRGIFRLKIWSKDPDHMFWVHSQLKSGIYNEKENVKTASILWEREQIHTLEHMIPFLHVFDLQIYSIIKFQKTKFEDTSQRYEMLEQVRELLDAPLQFGGSPNTEHLAGFFDVSSTVTFVKHSPRIYIEFKSKDVLEVLRDFLGAGKIYKMGSVYSILFTKWGTQQQLVQLLYPHIRHKKKHFTVLYDLFADQIDLQKAEETISFLNK